MATQETRAELITVVVAMFDAAPGVAVLSDLTAAADAGNSTALIAASLANSAEFKSIFPTFQTNAEFVSKFVDQMVGSLVSDAEKTTVKTALTAEMNAGASRVDVVLTAVAALKAIPTTDAVWGKASAAFANKVDVATYHTVEQQQATTTLADLKSVLAGVNDTAASVTSAKSEISGEATAGQIFTLTANADVLGPNSLTASTKTTAFDDTIYANADGALSAADIVNAGDGTDTLYSVQDVGAAETLTPILTSVERVFIDVNDTTAGTATTFTFNGSTSTGLQQIWVNAFSGSTTGTEDTFAITNVAKTVTTGIKGGDGEYNVTTTYTSTTGSSDSASLALDAASVDTVTLAGLETINIATSTGSSTVATLTATSLGTLNITGDKNLTVTNNIDFKDATDTLAFDGTVDATGLSGNLTLTLGTGGDNVKFTGGSGTNTVTTGGGNDNLTGGAKNDTFTLGGGNDTVSTGAGNDRVSIGLANLTSDDSINLGDGDSDALIIDAATLNAAGVNAANLALINKVSGLEVLATSGALTAIDASYFNQNTFEATADLTAAVTATNIAGDTIHFSGNGITGVNGDALTVSGALPNQSVTISMADTGAVKLQGTDGGAGNTGLTIASGISTVNLVSNAVSLTPSAITNEISLAAATTATHAIDNVSAGSFVLTGNASFTITSGATAGFTKAVDFNASAFNGKLSIVGSADADIIKGGNGADTIDGEDGADILTGGAGADTFVFVSTETGNAAPSASNFETITDFQKSVDIIDWDQALTIDAATAAATATVAQVSATGIATFHSSDDTLAEKLVAAVKGFDADGDFAIFEHSGDSYVIISGDANATLDAADTLIKLTGVTGLTGATIDGNGNLLIG